MRGPPFAAFPVLEDETEKLRDLLSKPGVQLADVVKHPAFFRLWREADSQLIEFVIDRFDEVINCVFDGTPTNNKFLKLRCVDIVKTGEPVRTILFERGKLGEFVMMFLRHAHEFSREKVSNFFSIASVVVLPSTGFHPYFETDEFFTLLLGLLSYEHCVEFFKFVLRRQTPGIAKILKRIKFCSILVSNLWSDTGVLRKRCLQTLIMALEEDTAYDILEPLIVNNELERIIRLALKMDSREMFDFLRVLLLKANEHIFALKWRRVKEVVNGHLKDFCLAIVETQKFTIPCESCTKLVCVIFEMTKTFTPDLRELVKKLSVLFFELETNSSVHNLFLRLIKGLSKTRYLTATFVEEMDLYAKILQCYSERSTVVTRAYWGQLRELANTINKYVGKAHVDQEQWRKVVIETNRQQEEIIAKPYGGSLPGEEPQNTDMFFVGAVAVIILVTTVIIVVPKLIPK